MEELGLYWIREGKPFNFNKEGFFKLLCLKKGTLTLKLDFKEQPMGANGFLVILPGTEIEVETGPDSEAILLAIAINCIKMDGRVLAADIFRLFVSFYKRPEIGVSAGAMKKIMQIMAMVEDEYVEKEASFDILWSYIKIILLLLVRDRGRDLTIPDKNLERLEGFFSLVAENAKKGKPIRYYAEKLNISTKRLNQVLQSITNKSPSYFIQEQLVIDAKRRLIKGDLTVNEIAYELGFTDRAYFSRFFKFWTGLPPNKFREAYFRKGQEKLFKEGILSFMADR